MFARACVSALLRACEGLPTQDMRARYTHPACGSGNYARTFDTCVHDPPIHPSIHPSIFYVCDLYACLRTSPTRMVSGVYRICIRSTYLRIRFMYPGEVCMHGARAPHGRRCARARAREHVSRVRKCVCACVRVCARAFSARACSSASLRLRCRSRSAASASCAASESCNII